MVMKKGFAIMFALVMLCTVSLTGFAEEDTSLQDILDKGELILGLDASFPPMGFVSADTGEIVGFDIDLALEVCRRLGIKLVNQPINWDAKEMELNAHHIDCIWNGMTITPERLESMSISLPYLSNDQVLVTRTADNVMDLAGLAGKRLGLQAGSSAEQALNSAEEFKASLGEVVPFDDNTVALQDLKGGGVDAVLVDIIVANYYKTVNELPFTILSESLAAEEYGIGFRKADVALCEKVNELLLEMKADGTMAKISTDWFGEDITIIGREAPANP